MLTNYIYSNRLNWQEPFASHQDHRHIQTSLLEAVVAALGIFVIVPALIGWLYYSLRRRTALREFKSSNIPIADNWSLFSGHLQSVLLRNDNCLQIDKLHHELGKTYALFYGPDSWVMTIDQELIRRVFIREGSTHVDRNQLRLPFGSEINESLAQLAGPEWRKVRHAMSASFTPKHMKSDNVYADIGRICDLFLALIEDTAEANQTTSGRDPSSSSSIDVNQAFKKYSLEVIFRIAFGRAHANKFVDGERDQLIDWIDQGSHLIVGPIVRLAIILGNSTVRRALGLLNQFTPLGSCIRYVHRVLNKTLRWRRDVSRAKAASGAKISGAGSQQDSKLAGERKMIDSLIERFERGKIGDKTLKANLFFVLLAGFETSANTLTAMFWLLAKHPTQQARLREALLADGGDQADYLGWVIHETLRLYPAVPCAFGRVLDHDIEHRTGEAGTVQLLRKGTAIVTSAWSLHRWPEYWGEPADVDRFEPQRFEARGVFPSLPYLAFGAGPHHCIGKHLALAEIKALASKILLQYRVTLAEDCPKQLETISPNMIHFIIPHPVKLVFTKLESASAPDDEKH